MTLVDQEKIAYSSMEIGLDPEMPTYSGGLGVLAGDTIRSAADLKVPMVAVSLLYRKGYFYQRMDETGWQGEEPSEWVINDYLEEMPARCFVTIEGRTVQLRAWKYEVSGVGGCRVPLFKARTVSPPYILSREGSLHQHHAPLHRTQRVFL
jgi:starch phosphorylase